MMSLSNPPMEVLVARSSHDSSGIPDGRWMAILVIGLVMGSESWWWWYDETVIPFLDGQERIILGVVAALGIVGIMMILMVVVRRKYRRVCVDEVHIMPGLGVQLLQLVVSSSSSLTLLRATSDPLFIPRQDIQNVLLTEVVSSYQVVTVLVFVLSNRTSSSSSFLQPVFPNVQLTYRESEQMWYELRKALDLPIE
uniref:Phosphatidylinositol N-acetylglucosaminyltransferase subunit H conserved domain-containing protein n=1 Tax=Attheya septentrionalis TaxID=420275 RepID=A0A6T7G3R8_9STRA|mmetsp:Transcript_16335/g.29727  ORF Transcript_16335/g.29727 Transcript_16335/m.29727 type:complete len:196 (+) Transcript_16335:234-821(+)